MCEVYPEPKCLESAMIATKTVPLEIEELAARAMELVRNGERASVSHFQRKLCIGYMQAVQVYELLDERGMIGES